MGEPRTPTNTPPRSIDSSPDFPTRESSLRLFTPLSPVIRSWLKPSLLNFPFGDSLSTGYTNYAAAYATGLLLARRLLSDVGLADTYKGVKETTGKDYDVSAEADTFKQSKRPFKAILDIGLVRSTIGNRVFAVLKGACDGGLHIPHNNHRFFGSERDDDSRKWSHSHEAHRDRIFGCHIDEYMEQLQKEEDKAYGKTQFTKWIKCLKDAGVDSVEDLFKKIHEGVRSDPKRQGEKKQRYKPEFNNESGTEVKTQKDGKDSTYKRNVRLDNAQRKARVQQKIQIGLQMLEDDDEEDDE